MNNIKLTSEKIGKEEVKELRKKLLEDFLQAYPLQSLLDISLDQYTNLNKEDSFCYWLESRTYELGSIWGGSSSKFDFRTLDLNVPFAQIEKQLEEYVSY